MHFIWFGGGWRRFIKRRIRPLIATTAAAAAACVEEAQI
jgi:hypothetical protein